MKRRAFILAALLVPTAAACTPTAPAKVIDRTDGGTQVRKPDYDKPVTTSADVTSVVGSTNRFAAAMYEQLQAEPGNMAFSPASIGLALNMTRAGARGDTATQMASTLSIQLEDKRAHAAFGSLLHGWNYGERPYKLAVANRLFGEKTLAFKKPFVSITGEQYGAELEPLSFVTEPEAARQRINAWVEEQTQDRIKELLPDKSIKKKTRLVLTNAIYFKGKWKVAFDEKDTRSVAFHSPGGQTQAPMMHLTSRFRYAAADGMQLVELPYKGDELAMTILVPDATDGIGELQKKLTAENIRKWLQDSVEQDVSLGLPRFKIDPDKAVRLKKMLIAMGMRDAFDKQRADLTGIADVAGGRLVIDDAYHKAFVEVNEEGTEAAAATAVVVNVESAVVVEKVVTADRPFVFLIRDTKTGAILFMGRVVNPTATAA